MITTEDGKLMEYMKLDPKATTSWRIKRGISFAVLVVICAVITLFAPYEELYGKVIEIAVTLFLLYKLIGLIVYPMIEYRQWGYKISEDKVDIQHGIFFVKHTVIPVIRIQHITVSQGPINRQLGLYEVEISLASGSFSIECLSKDVADEIADNLKAKLYNRLESGEAGSREEE